MKTKWVENSEKYDGTQLKSLRNYLKHGLLGDSVIAWAGECDISFEHMMDGEDLLAKEKICGKMMLHFVFEVFDVSLLTAVALQRIFADHVRTLISEKSLGKISLLRRGDDLYFGDKKLSISIAVPAVNSNLVHFAVNITNEGTPVKTCSLVDFQIEPVSFAELVMTKFATEWESMREATWKVRPILQSE